MGDRKRWKDPQSEVEEQGPDNEKETVHDRGEDQEIFKARKDLSGRAIRRTSTARLGPGHR